MTDAAWILTVIYAMAAAGFTFGAAKAGAKYRPNAPSWAHWIGAALCAPFWPFLFSAFAVKVAARMVGEVVND